jgi:hypothetical protein
MTVHLCFPRKLGDWSFGVLVNLDVQAGKLAGEMSENVDNATPILVVAKPQLAGPGKSMTLSLRIPRTSSWTCATLQSMFLVSSL